SLRARRHRPRADPRGQADSDGGARPLTPAGDNVPLSIAAAMVTAPPPPVPLSDQALDPAEPAAWCRGPGEMRSGPDGGRIVAGGCSLGELEQTLPATGGAPLEWRSRSR